MVLPPPICNIDYRGSLSQYQPLIDNLLAKHPEDRYQTASELLEAAENATSLG